MVSECLRGAGEAVCTWKVAVEQDQRQTDYVSASPAMMVDANGFVVDGRRCGRTEPAWNGIHCRFDRRTPSALLLPAAETSTLRNVIVLAYRAHTVVPGD